MGSQLATGLTALVQTFAPFVVAPFVPGMCFHREWSEEANRPALGSEEKLAQSSTKRSRERTRTPNQPHPEPPTMCHKTQVYVCIGLNFL